MSVLIYGFLTNFFHINLCAKFKANIFLKNYHIYEVRFPDQSDYEYERRVLKKAKICIPKYFCMALDYAF